MLFGGKDRKLNIVKEMKMSFLVGIIIEKSRKNRKMKAVLVL